METIKKWVKSQENKYEFYIQDEKKGNMLLDFGGISQQAKASWENEQFQIERIGFWKNKLQITNSNHQIILQVEPEKWYSNKWNIDFDGKKYTLVVRNNPLTEYIILDNHQEQISYSLYTHSGLIYTKISNYTATPIIFDFLLWYLFYPIAQENTIDSTFFMLAL